MRRKYQSWSMVPGPEGLIHVHRARDLKRRVRVDDRDGRCRCNTIETSMVDHRCFDVFTSMVDRIDVRTIDGFRRCFRQCFPACMWHSRVPLAIHFYVFLLPFSYLSFVLFGFFCVNTLINIFLLIFTVFLALGEDFQSFWERFSRNIEFLGSSMVFGPIYRDYRWFWTDVSVLDISTGRTIR